MRGSLQMDPGSCGFDYIFNDDYAGCENRCLREIKPLIWRRIIVPEAYSFWDLHVAIQDVMGWTDTHLHEFVINFPGGILKASIGIPDEDEPEGEQDILPGWKYKIKKFFTLENNKADFLYYLTFQLFFHKSKTFFPTVFFYS